MYFTDDKTKHRVVEQLAQANRTLLYMLNNFLAVSSE